MNSTSRHCIVWRITCLITSAILSGEACNINHPPCLIRRYTSIVIVTQAWVVAYMYVPITTHADGVSDWNKVDFKPILEIRYQSNLYCVNLTWRRRERGVRVARFFLGGGGCPCSPSTPLESTYAVLGAIIVSWQRIGSEIHMSRWFVIGTIGFTLIEVNYI